MTHPKAPWEKKRGKKPTDGYLDGVKDTLVWMIDQYEMEFKRIKERMKEL